MSAWTLHRAGIPMSLSSRCLRRSVFSLLWMLSGACAAQQFQAMQAGPVGGPVASVLTGSFQQGGTLPDILYIGAPVATGAASTVTAGELLNAQGQGFSSPSEDQITFSGVSNAVAALGDFDGDGLVDYAFVLSPAVAGSATVCIYYGAGAQAGSGISSYSGGNAYPPAGGKSGCASFATKGSLPPNLAYVAALPFRAGSLPQLIVEDSANGFLYVLANDGATGANGALNGITVKATIEIAPADGAGPIFTGDFNGDGSADFIVNGQTGDSASVYLGNGDGTFQAPVRYTFDHNVRSMLMHDMDGDGRADMVVEGDNGVIEIFHGNADGGFATTSVGGIAAGAISGVGVSHVGIGGDDGTSGQLQGTGRDYALRVVVDMNGDGLPDLVLSDGALVKVLYNRGGGGFGGEQLYFAGWTVNSLLTVDVDGDGALDLIVAGGGPSGYGNTGGITVLTNAAAAGWNSAGGPRVRPLAATVPTTVTLALCVGGSVPNCPVIGVPSGLAPVSPLTMFYGQVFNGTENVTDSNGTAFGGTGTLDFYQDGVLLCTLAPTGGSSCPPSVGVGTVAGSHVFTSVYSGDATYEGSTSNPVTINVLPDTTTATLTSSANPASFGQPVTFTATLTGTYAAPTGPVQFGELFPPTTSAALLGTVMLVPGPGLSSTATFTISTLPVGTDPIIAGYQATQNFGLAASNVVNEVITPVIGSSAALTSSLDPSTVGQAVTFTATVSTGVPGQVATGSVSFLNGSKVLGMGTLNGSGVATFTTSTLPAGNDAITASYPGGSAFGASSASLVQTVYSLPSPGSVNFTIAVTPNPVSVGVGTGTLLTVTVTPLPGFTESVNLSCGNMPTEAACGAASVGPAGGAVGLYLTTAAPHDCGATQPYFYGSNGGGPMPFALPAIAGLIAICVPGRRRWLRGLVAMAAVAAAMQVGGCGNCTDLGTRPATYTIQVMGTAAGGTPEVESQSVTLYVTL